VFDTQEVSGSSPLGPTAETHLVMVGFQHLREDIERRDRYLGGLSPPTVWDHARITSGFPSLDERILHDSHSLRDRDVLPDPNHLPTSPLKSVTVFLIPLFVPCQLPTPVFGVGSPWCIAVSGTRVPAIDEHCDSTAGKTYVRSTDPSEVLNSSILEEAPSSSVQS
jgi:hypothetical protein